MQKVRAYSNLARDYVRNSYYTIKSRFDKLPPHIKKPVLVVTVAIVVETIAILSQPQYPRFVYVKKVVEPYAPLSTEVHLQQLSPSDETALQEPNQIAITDLAAEPYVESIKYSPDKSRILILSWTSDPAGYKKGDPEATVNPTLKLKLFDQDQVLLAVIEDKDVLNADFSSNNQLYYQKQGVMDYGMYAYQIKSGVKKRFIDYYDPESFNNVVLISDDTFFFLQPKTGKYGKGSVSSGKLNILGQNATVMNTVLYQDLSVYSDLTISPDRKKIAFYENVSEPDRFTRNLLIFNTADFKIDQPLAKITVEDMADASSVLYSKYEWGADGNRLVTGTDASVVDIGSNALVFRGTEGRHNEIKVSPDGLTIMHCVTEDTNKKCKIKALNPSTPNALQDEIPLPDDVGEFEWLDNQTAAFSIGKSLYDINTTRRLLEKVVDERANYRILAKNDQSLVVQSDSSLLKIESNH